MTSALSPTTARADAAGTAPLARPFDTEAVTEGTAGHRCTTAVSAMERSRTTRDNAEPGYHRHRQWGTVRRSRAARPSLRNRPGCARVIPMRPGTGPGLNFDLVEGTA
ncbi:hypothetical protein BC793_105371 [Actinoplanes xinjiangensis]|uniref:Uncharacterized protein n=1 Tax=Actinoplanes xinjiangensis TaxID=512350 RepID=A0A316FMS7_9ACTN|nr:hypothetical protein BC793_105371 [Actinoplanes xinjiangensis]GIF38727.1 hypothetical protein Axi01nite_30380 [Actinoplanes xinjiangensis]